MAPYSKVQNKHLLVHLSFPSDIDVGFKERFKTLVNDFNAQELVAEAAAAKAAADETASKAAAEKAAAKAAAEQASRDAASNEQAAFGAASMSGHQFSQGKFKVLFSDGYQTNHSTQIGLAKVDYSCQAEQGSFNVFLHCSAAGLCCYRGQCLIRQSHCQYASAAEGCQHATGFYCSEKLSRSANNGHN